MDGTEGASGLDQLHQFGVAGEKPLKTVGASAERKVRGEPEGLRLRTGAPTEVTAGREVEGGRNQVGLEGSGGGRGGRV